MAVRTDQVAVNVEINGQRAGTTLKDLEATAKQLRRELRQLPVDSQEFANRASELNRVNAQLREIGQTIRGVDRNLQQSTTQVSIWKQALSGAASVITGMFSVNALMAAGNAVISLVKEGFEGVKEAAENTAQLEAVIKSTGGAAGLTRVELDEMALSMRKATGIDDEPIRKSMAVLLTFTNITKETFGDAEKAILDVSVALGQDLQSSTVQVGKALNDPIKGITALQKVGVTFTLEQKKMIERLVETNDVAGAQKIILQELGREFGGVAEAVGATEGGPLQRLKLLLEDIRDELASKLVPIFNQFIRFITDLVERSAPIQDIFRGIFNIFGQVWDLIKQLLASFGLFTGKVDAAGVVIKALTYYFQLATTQIRVVITIIREFLTALNYIVAAGNGTLNALRVVFTGIRELAVATFSGLSEMITGAVTFDSAAIQRGLDKTRGSFAKYGQDVADAYSQGFNVIRQRQLAAVAEQDKAETEANANLAKRRAREAVVESEEDKKKREKAAQEAIKKRLELKQRLLEIDNQVRAAEIDAMQDGIVKDQAREDIRYQLQLQSIARQIQEMRKLGASESEIQSKSDKLKEAEHAKHLAELEKIDDKYASAAEEKNKKSAEEAKKLADQAAKEKEEKYKAEVDLQDSFYRALLLGNKNYTTSLLEQENLGATSRQQILENAKTAQEEIESQRIDALRALNEEYGKSTLEQDEALAAKRQENAQRSLDLRLKAEDVLRQGLGESFQFGIDLLSQDEESRKKNASVIKAFTVGQIIVDTEREISGYFANPASTVTFGAAGALRAVLALARAGLSIAKVTSTQFSDGGYTGPFSPIADNKGRKVAGIVHTDEWVAPEWITKHPVYGRVIHQLEGIRLKGFANGGFTTTPTHRTVDSIAAAGNTDDGKLDRLISAVENWPRVVKGVFTYNEIRDILAGGDEVAAAGKMK